MTNNLWRDLYVKQTDHYERLVQWEDYQGRLIAAIDQIQPLADQVVVEFGAGTGRITAQLAPRVKQARAFDLTPPMIRRAQGKLSRAGYTNGGLAVADSRAMPLPDGCAGVAVEGWSFVQIMTWHPTTWRQEVGRAMREMLRVLRPGGVAILIETLGTGETTPKPPDRFIPAYDYFELEWGFSRTWIRTDFRFPTLAEAQATIAPLFGEAVLARATATDEGVILPECTGVWWCFV